MTLTAEVTANSRLNGLCFGLQSGGVLSKESDTEGVWSGTVATTGTAGYFRFKANEVDGDGASTTLVRVDGNCGTGSSADMQMTSTSLVAGVVVTVDTFDVTFPKVRT
jgi:hypothetical protein